MPRSHNLEDRRPQRLPNHSIYLSDTSSATSDVVVSEKSGSGSGNASGSGKRKKPVVRSRPCRNSRSDSNSFESSRPSKKKTDRRTVNHLTPAESIPALEKPPQDEHGFLFIDADEAVHSLYVLISKSIEFGKSGDPQKLIDDLLEEAALLEQSPATYLAHDVAPASAIDFGMTVGSSVLVCFFAVLAIKAGAHEIKDAAALRKVLKTQRAAIRKTLDQIHDGQQSLTLTLLRDLEDKVNDGGLMKKVNALLEIVSNQSLGTEQRLSQIEEAIDIAHMDYRIGQASAFSGSIILSKALAEAINAAISAAATGHFDVAHLILSSGSIAGWITPAATAVGAMSTLALGPAAGLGAVILGSYFVHKSRLTHKRLKNETAQWRHDLFSMRSGASFTTADEEYLQFTEMKLAQRAKFARTFLRWNSLFLTGSTVYCASTLAKTAMTASVLAGAAAAANPVGLGVLLGILIASGIGMTIGSQQFLHMHDKQKRYDKYRYLDDIRIDRHRLAAVDLCHPTGVAAGVTLRSKAYAMFRDMDQARQRLLVAASAGSQQHYRSLAHTADSQPRKPLISFTLSRKEAAGKWIRGQLAADRAFFSGILQGDSFKAARAARNAVWAAKQPNLNKQSLDAWCQRPENFDAQKKFMSTSLSHQNSFLSLKSKILAETDGHPLMQDSEIEIRNDAARLAAGRRLRQKLRARGDISADQLRRYKTEFFRILGQSESTDTKNGDHPPDSDASFDKRFASWLLKEEYCDLRGILLETELQASALRQKTQSQDAEAALEKNEISSRRERSGDESSSLVESSRRSEESSDVYVSASGDVQLERGTPRAGRISESRRRSEESSDVLVSESEEVHLGRRTPRANRFSESRRRSEESSDMYVSASEDVQFQRRTPRVSRPSRPVLVKRRSIESLSVSDSSITQVSRRRSAPTAYLNGSGRGQTSE